jgi:hypothetical protein
VRNANVELARLAEANDELPPGLVDLTPTETHFYPNTTDPTPRNVSQGGNRIDALVKFQKARPFQIRATR